MTRAEAKATAAIAGTMPGILRAKATRAKWYPGGYSVEIIATGGWTVWGDVGCVDRWIVHGPRLQLKEAA